MLTNVFFTSWRVAVRKRTRRFLWKEREKKKNTKQKQTESLQNSQLTSEKPGHGIFVVTLE